MSGSEREVQILLAMAKEDLDATRLLRNFNLIQVGHYQFINLIE